MVGAATLERKGPLGPAEKRPPCCKARSFLAPPSSARAWPPPASRRCRRFARGAGKPVVRIGYLDSFSGVFADIAALHKTGAQLALDDVNRNSRVRFEFVFGDDASKPATGTTETRRLVGEEKVDVLFGGTSSGIGLAIAPLVEDLGIFNLALGPFDSTLTGEKATRLTYRYGATRAW